MAMNMPTLGIKADSTYDQFCGVDISSRADSMTIQLRCGNYSLCVDGYTWGISSPYEKERICFQFRKECQQKEEVIVNSKK